MSETAATVADLFRREPGTERPRIEQIRAVWAWLSFLRVQSLIRPEVEGAYRAAEWAIGLTDVPPVTGARYHTPSFIVEAAWTRPGEHDIIKPATDQLIAGEINTAGAIAEAGADPVKREYAGGTYALLAWWAGIVELAEFLTPNSVQLAARPMGVPES
ncbi:hypothetical protein [Actinopolymorpha pittospori]|uniref:Uncharacterized protein n=1 Tax=Actinopolymorpha pittospori TaxID=648752 RepID=A0A927N1L6_9ACTN|nr:hypothetical protein [Actinopolymorpha pittospori]MBE1607272.1 hypothetical protein [Actinopolymorpha pittospori]